MAVTSEYLHANTGGEMEELCVKREEGEPRTCVSFSLRSSHPTGSAGTAGGFFL